MNTPELKRFYVMLVVVILISLWIPQFKNESDLTYGNIEIFETEVEQEVFEPIDIKETYTPLTVVYSNMCPESWMGYTFHGSYEQLVANEKIRTVCDYKGTVTDEQCDKEEAMLISGGNKWCQKLLNNDTFLLSIKRK